MPSEPLEEALSDRWSTTDPRSALRLTRREADLVESLLEGCTNKEIALRLGISDQTVKNQLTALYQKAGVRNRLGLVALTRRIRLKQGS